VRQGRVAEADLDAKVVRLLSLIDRVGLLDHAGSPAPAPSAASGPELAAAPAENPQDRPEDRALLREAAAGSIVLLANNGVLPLEPSVLATVALVGPKAEFPGILGGGSARVRPHYRLSLLEVLKARLGPGARVLHEAADTADSIGAAVEVARRSDVAIVVVGTDDKVESEGFDRETMDLPGLQDELVRRVMAANPRTVVVVSSGAPVTMSWARDAAGLVQSFFGGQEMPNALVDVLVGDAEPGGRLPTTLPERIEHTPAFSNFPAEASHVRYAEGLLIGYRWYEARCLPVAFPFGHGLSYTSFSIGEPVLSSQVLNRGGRVRIDVPVRNTGARRGAEVVQCYVAPPGGGRSSPGGHFRPAKELRAFAKVWLDAGESATVTLELGERAFAYYDAADGDWAELDPSRPHRQYWQPLPWAHHDRSGWYVAPGTYELLVGRSSADITQRSALAVEGGDEPLDPAVPAI
jgi:beta-glucosidase